MLYLRKGVWTIGLPVVLSIVSVIKNSVILYILFILAHFLVIKITPAFRHRESIWMFVIVAVSSIPVNVMLLEFLRDVGILYGGFVNLFMKNLLGYVLLLSVEEVVMGTITRLIWKRQYKSIM